MSEKYLTQKTLTSIFNDFNKLKVFVIGDAMLDNYWSGNIERISPEAPVPIVSIHKKESRLGGCANVALNCKSLGAEVHLLSVIGHDDAGLEILKQLKKNKIHYSNCFQSDERITTTKTRVISKHQQVIRFDEEITKELSIKDEHHFIDKCLRAIQIEKPDVVIFEDYNKGVLKKNVIEKIITHCKHVGVLTAVDPKKDNFLSYIGVDIFKPNLKEIKEALNVDFDKINSKTLSKVHQTLSKHLHHKITLLTLSEYGVFSQSDHETILLPAHYRNIADVSGAGDTVIAVAAMTYSISKNQYHMTAISNLAGGIVCEETGVVSISKEKLFKESILNLDAKN